MVNIFVFWVKSGAAIGNKRNYCVPQQALKLLLNYGYPFLMFGAASDITNQAGGYPCGAGNLTISVDFRKLEVPAV